MTHLDTNFLILALVPGTDQDRRLRGWLAAGEEVGLSVIAWAEFLCGPVSPEQARLAQVLFPNPQPLMSADAARAAELFNASGRRRGSLADCLMAATCMRVGAALATENPADFRAIEPLGLRLA
jgi:predicted nucleic acid-binding protein